MSSHDPAGTSACLHSICVRSEWRRKGVAIALLKEYTSRLQSSTSQGQDVQRILLICHEELIGLYEKAGYTLVGKSDVVHGPREWWEMKHELQLPQLSKDSVADSSSIPPEVFSSLLKPSGSGSAKIARQFDSFASTQELTTDDGNTGAQINRFKLVCPRKGCHSLILLAGVGRLVEAASVQVSCIALP